MNAPTGDEPAARAAAMEALARAGARQVSLEAEGGGLSNHVYRARLDDGEVIVRVGAEPGKLQAFHREAEVTSRAREAGIPAPQVLAVAEVDALAVMIARAVPGELARDHPERIRTLRDLGALAAQRIHAIRTHGFGRDFELDGGDGPIATWRDWLTFGFRAQEKLHLLARHGLTADKQQDELQQTLEEVTAWSGAPILNHGDLRLKNVLVAPDGAITGLLDWENSLSAPSPHWDLSLALHDLWVDQAQALLDGYGLTSDEVIAAAPVWRLFNALNYVPEVERALHERDEEALDQMRLRFSGALDLFGRS